MLFGSSGVQGVQEFRWMQGGRKRETGDRRMPFGQAAALKQMFTKGRLRMGRCRLALQNRLFGTAEQAVREHETGCLGMRNGTSGNTLSHRRLRKAGQIANNLYNKDAAATPCPAWRATATNAPFAGCLTALFRINPNRSLDRLTLVFMYVAGFPNASILLSASCQPLCLDVARYAVDKGDCQSARQ